MRRLILLLVALATVAGCRTGTLPDPNDPAAAGAMAPDVLRQNLKGVSDMLNERLETGEINRREYQALIQRAANELLEKTQIDFIAPERAWEYVEVLRAAGQWDAAVKYARVAVDHAKRTKNSDRFVNDSLRLAEALAQTNKVPEAIRTARTTFNVERTAMAPILMATLYEIVKAGEQKGHDVALARLLEEAIRCHELTIVDPKTEAGKAFLGAKPTHLRRAWTKVIQLYLAGRRDDLARQAAERADKSLSNLANV